MKWIKFLFNVVMAMFIGAAAQTYLGLNAYAVAGTVMTAGVVLPLVAPQLVKDTAFMAITVEIWQNHIEEEIFKKNTFMRKSFNADEYVIGGKVVHIPQSGGSGNVVKNRANLPAAVRKRNDTDIVYVIDEFTTDPVVIPDADTKELTYDKRSSVLGEDNDKLVEVVAEETLYNWVNSPVYGVYGATTLPSKNILLTSGDASAATATGATGERKKAALVDLQRMATKFKNEGRWFEGKMHALLTPQMEADLFPADSLITATYMAAVTEEERRRGIMYKVQGWNIESRSTVLRTDGDGGIIAPGEVGDTDHCDAALFWYENAVEFAWSGVKAFQTIGDPTYYGDLYSFLARSGSRARRAGYEGVALLRQTPTV
ncbi:hypothetical protein [Litoribacter populi]|uniref:hypothetical protein n=1 Tax=Litoribacter populi TaxID=2598460 RepID=UPI001C8F598D|nr:hypothetical protein [Litoribacter populi]